MPFSSIFPFGSTGNQYNLTIVYKSAAEEIIAPTYTAQLSRGAEYSVSSPEIPGYTVGERQEVVSGTMPARDVQVNVIYLPSTIVDWDFTLRQSPAFEGSQTDPIVAGKKYTVTATFTNNGLYDLSNVQLTCDISGDIYNFDSVASGESKTEELYYWATGTEGTITFVANLTADTIDPDNPTITDSATFTFGVER